jgi:hypothetical protein
MPGSARWEMIHGVATGESAVSLAALAERIAIKRRSKIPAQPHKPPKNELH